MKMNVIVFLGSIRNSTPPTPARLGERVSLYCNMSLMAQGHKVTLVDPLDLDTGLDETNRAFKPLFSYAPDKAPKDLLVLAKKIRDANAYVMISPEYNHSMSPALANLLNHFGSSLFSYKPSSIVTYSAGQWGGTRAAIPMRTYLSELGCLPVSAMVHVPKAQEVFGQDGKISSAQNATSWETYFSRTWAQMHWWAQAAQNQRELVNPETLAKPFISDPSQRNAGTSEG